MIRHLSFDQPDEYLRTLGWPSGSTLVNNIVLLVILLMITIFHVLFCLLNKLTKDKQSKCSTMVKKTYRFLTFTLYIRIFILAYMFVMLLAAFEIKNYYKNEGGEDFGHQKGVNKNEVKGNYVSLAISCTILVLLFSFVLLTLLSWARNKDTVKIEESCKTRELYAAISKAPKRCLYEEQEGQGDEAEHPENSIAVPLTIKIARLYYLLFLIKRTIMILIAVFIPDSAFVLKICLFLILQIACILYACFIRSFANKKDQIVEILNEIVVLVLLALLTKYNSEEKWTDASENAFVLIILLHS